MPKLFFWLKKKVFFFRSKMRLTGRKGCFAALGEAAQVSKILFVYEQNGLA